MEVKKSLAISGGVITSLGAGAGVITPVVLNEFNKSNLQREYEVYMNIFIELSKDELGMKLRDKEDKLYYNVLNNLIIEIQATNEASYKREFINKTKEFGKNKKIAFNKILELQMNKLKQELEQAKNSESQLRNKLKSQLEVILALKERKEEVKNYISNISSIKTENNQEFIIDISKLQHSKINKELIANEEFQLFEILELLKIDNSTYELNNVYINDNSDNLKDKGLNFKTFKTDIKTIKLIFKKQIKVIFKVEDEIIGTTKIKGGYLYFEDIPEFKANERVKEILFWQLDNRKLIFREGKANLKYFLDKRQEVVINAKVSFTNFAKFKKAREIIDTIFKIIKTATNFELIALALEENEAKKLLEFKDIYNKSIIELKEILLLSLGKKINKEVIQQKITSISELLQAINEVAAKGNEKLRRGLKLSIIIIENIISESIKYIYTAN